MPTIFAIDGADFGDLGAFSQSVARLQSWLVTLGQKTGNATLQALMVDGLIGPKTQAATNLALAQYVGGGGSLTQAQISARADELANLIQAEIARAYPSTGGVIATVAQQAAPKTTAVVPTGTTPTYAAVVPTVVPVPSGDSMQATIIKWSAIGLGLVVVSSLVYAMLKRRGSAMAEFGGFGDFGMKGGRINDHERELWVNNDEGLYRKWKHYVRELYNSGRDSQISMPKFIKRNRAEIDAVIRGVRDRPPAQTRFYGSGTAAPTYKDFRLRWNPVAQVWHVVWHDQIIPIHDERSFATKEDAKVALRYAGLKLVAGNRVVTA